MSTLSLTIGKTYISRSSTHWRIIGHYLGDRFIGIRQDTGQEAFFFADGRRWFRPIPAEDLIREVDDDKQSDLAVNRLLSDYIAARDTVRQVICSVEEAAGRVRIIKQLDALESTMNSIINSHTRK